MSYLGSVVHDRGEVVGARLRSGVLAVELRHVLTHIIPRDVQVRVSVEPEVDSLVSIELVQKDKKC